MYLIGNQKNSLSLPAGDRTSDVQNSYTPNSPVLGKIISVITISSPSDKVPGYFYFQYKHSNGATTVFKCKNGKFYDGNEKEITGITYDGSEITLAITYDTNGTQGEIYVLENGSYRLVTTYTYIKNENPVSRLGYFYLPKNSNKNSIDKAHELKFIVTHYGIEEN